MYLIILQTYDVKVMLSRNALLVDIVGESIGRVLKLDSIQAGQTWKGIYVMIFDSWHWWIHTGRKTLIERKWRKQSGSEEETKMKKKERKRRKQIGGEMTQTKEAGLKLVGK